MFPRPNRFRRARASDTPSHPVFLQPVLPPQDRLNGTHVSGLQLDVQRPVLLAEVNNRKRMWSNDGPKMQSFKRQCVSSSPLHHQAAFQSSAGNATLSTSSASTVTSHPASFVPSLRQWFPQSPDLSHLVKDKLSRQILDLFLECEQQTEDLEKKERCRAMLQKDIESLFPGESVQVLLVGSSLNGFGSRTSDADLCLLFHAKTHKTKKTEAVNVLATVHTLLRKLPYIKKPQLIPAKVPILKFRSTSGIEFDLNFSNIVGIRNTFLLRMYAYVEQRVRPVMLAIKKWARYRNINDASAGTLSSYTLVLMALHYLQTLSEPVIPCLQKDFPECFDPKMDINNLPRGLRSVPAFQSKNRSTLGDLLLGFLKYYATAFKWEKHVISVRQAAVFNKDTSKEWRNKFICVEEPFNQSNTARAVQNSFKFEAIKAEFLRSFQVLQLRKDLNFILPVTKTKNLHQ